MAIRILMIDDDIEDCEIVGEYLREAGESFGEHYEFESISDYELARARMLDSNHDLYILDHRIGPVRGVELLGELRHHGFDRPVILCSGNVDRAAKMDAAMYGVSDMLNKQTLSPVALRNSICFALGRGNRSAHDD